MTGKVLESNPKGLLVLILPLATAMVLLYKAWRIILVIGVLIMAWTAWDTYQWQKKCTRIDPIFNQLVRTNQGMVTKNDLINQGIAQGRAAQRYLNDKVAEYGAYQRTVQGMPIYYFITSSTLGTIFDDSEPEDAEVDNSSPQLSAATTLPVELSAPQPEACAKRALGIATEPAESSPNTTPFSSLAEIKEERKQVPLVEPPSLSPEETSPPTLELIQSELAKRLDTTSSTIARRKDSPDFSKWSQTKDPDGWSWSYEPDSKLFKTV